MQLLGSLTQCLTTDPLSTSVWKQLYPKHLSQSRQVGVGSRVLVYTEKPPGIFFQTRAGVSYQKHQSLFSRLPPLRSVRTQLGGLKELLLVGVFWDSEPRVLVAVRGGRPSGLLTDRSLLLHSLLLEYLLESWEQIPKKVRN